MLLRGKRITEITSADIKNLVVNRAPEDSFLEFKRHLFHPEKPPEIINEERGDLVADLISFANAQGGHLIVGIEEDELGRASDLKPMPGETARDLANSLRDLAIAYIRPPLALLEVQALPLDGPGAEWIVIAVVQESQDKPHMSTYNDNTRFAVRDGRRKRPMRFEEISRLFLSGPHEQMLSRIVFDISELKTIITSLATRSEK